MQSGPKTILWVDPEAHRSGQLKSVLEELFYQVRSATSEKEAAQIVGHQTPDLVIASMDGEAKGQDLCRRLKGHGPTQHVPVILTSLSPDAEALFSRHQKEKGKADSYIKMPSPPEDVVDFVERLIGLPAPNGHEKTGVSASETGTDEGST
ncbi:MAG TPA: response regulator, partial [Bdellovibrionota bacterium]|nr:response regulator [Bdellovibrionota bacterium]